MKKVYVAGKLCDNEEREFLEKVAEVIEGEGFETFLPHRDVGLARGIEDAEKIFNGDIIEGLKDCSFVVAVLNGLHVGAGTSWELGYAYAKGIPAIGIKTDEPIEDAIEYLSAIIIHSTKVVSSIDELKKEVRKLI